LVAYEIKEGADRSVIAYPGRSAARSGALQNRDRYKLRSLS
jgi:hypothetical protein